MYIHHPQAQNKNCNLCYPMIQIIFKLAGINYVAFILCDWGGQWWTEEMAQKLKVLASLPEDLGSVLYDFLQQPVPPFPEDPMSFYGLFRHQAYTCYICKQNLHTKYGFINLNRPSDEMGRGYSVIDFLQKV